MQDFIDLISTIMKLVEDYEGPFNNLRYEVDNNSIRDEAKLREIWGEHSLRCMAENLGGSTIHFEFRYHRERNEFYVNGEYERPQTAEKTLDRLCQEFKINTSS